MHHHDILIIGAGFGGLGMAIRLKQAGLHDFVVVEKDAGIGGTWWANRYPGAACDIPSHLYSFSFAPNPNWTRHYPPQAEIETYLQHCAQRFGIEPHVQLHTAVTSARFDEVALRWTVTLAGPGGSRSVTARVIVAATGGLSRPAVPSLPGLADFQGRAFHTARWPQDLDLRGRRVGVVGTGASAIQIVPAIVDEVAQLTLFQRTPAWVLPKPDGPIAPWRRRLYARWPVTQRIARGLIYLQHESRALGFTRFPALLRTLGRLATLHLRRQVRDATLREQLTPKYVMGCKRILLANDFYHAVQRANARVVTAGVERIVTDGVVTSDGQHHALDTLVLATGFDVADAKAPFPITGRAGASFDDAWRHGPTAYLGCSVPGFPNLFMITGPNSGLGHNSMVYMIESHIAYIMEALAQLRARGADAADVTVQAHRRVDSELQQRLARTVWATGGCNSWYRSASGRITTLWPGSTFEFRRRTRRFVAADHELLSVR